MKTGQTVNITRGQGHFVPNVAPLFTWGAIMVVKNHSCTSPTRFIPTQRGACTMAIMFLGCIAFMLTKLLRLKLSVKYGCQNRHLVYGLFN